MNIRLHSGALVSRRATSAYARGSFLKANSYFACIACTNTYCCTVRDYTTTASEFISIPFKVLHERNIAVYTRSLIPRNSMLIIILCTRYNAHYMYYYSCIYIYIYSVCISIPMNKVIHTLWCVVRYVVIEYFNSFYTRTT